MANTHYVSILKGKKAEYDALSELSASDKANLTPLIEVGAIPVEPKTKKPKKTIDQHLDVIALALKESWGDAYPVFIDTAYLASAPFPSNGEHTMLALGRLALAHRVKFVPVTGLYRSEEYQVAVKELVKLGAAGMCLRLNGGDLVDPDMDIEKAVASFLKDCGLKAGQVDLVLDFRDIPRAADERIFALAVRSAITDMPLVNEWKTFTFAASGFPEQLSADFGFVRDEISTAPRVEWNIWQYLRSQAGELPRLPDFGDYGVFHPRPVEFDYTKMQMAAKIRYTSEGHWLIVKGRSTKEHGFEQYFDLAKKLIEHPEYCGRDFSPGDAYIYERGTKAKGATSGSQATWIQAGIAHHMAFVLHQLSNPGAA